MKQLFAIGISALVLTGCTTLTTDSPSNLGLKLEKTDSWVARISAVNITSANPGLWVRGSVVRFFPGKGPIYGHLHIDLLDGNGEKIAGAITKPMRTNRNSRRASENHRLGASAGEGGTNEHGVQPAALVLVGGRSMMRGLPKRAGNGNFGGDRECCAMTDKDMSGANFRKAPLARMLAGLCHV